MTIEGEIVNIPVKGNELEELNDSQVKTTYEQPPLMPSLAVVSNQSAYSYMKQGIATGKLTTIRTDKKDGVENATFDYESNTLSILNGSFRVDLTNYKNGVSLRGLTHILFHILIFEFSKNPSSSSNAVSISLEDYMALRNVKKEDKAREQVKKDLDTLFNCYLYFTDKSRGKKKDYVKVRILEAQGIKNGYISVMFGSIFADILRRYPVMPFPLSIFQVNTQLMPYAYPMMMKILQHKRMNEGKPNANFIAVDTLLEAGGFPKYSSIKATGQIEQRIIEPFRKNLDVWDKEFSWEFCHEHGEPLTDEELQDFTYAVFSKLNVWIHWHDYPDQTKRIERKQKQIAAARRRKAAREKKAAEEAAQKKVQGSLI